MKSKIKWLCLAAVSLLIVTAVSIPLVTGASAQSGCPRPMLDWVNIGKVPSENQHNIQGWSSIWKGYPWSGPDGDMRLIWGDGGESPPTSTNNWASVDLNTGARYAKVLRVEHLDGAADDGFNVYVNGNLVGTYVANMPDTRNVWYVTNFDISSGNFSGSLTVKFEATGPPWGGIVTYGQVAFNMIELYGEYTLTASPDGGYNPVKTNHTIAASIDPVDPDVTVNFDLISGPNSGKSGSDDTNSNGVAEFTYTGSGGAGLDTIRAWIDQDCNGDYNAGDPSAVVTKYWLEHYVTGGGNINTGKGKKAAKITFGGNVGLDLEGNPVGQWNAVIHNVGDDTFDKTNFHTTDFIEIVWVDRTDWPDPSPPDADYNYVHFVATGKLSGEEGWTIKVNMTDFGEGNEADDPDEIRIRLWEPGNNWRTTPPVYDSSAPDGDFPDTSYANRTALIGGNIQIHPPDIP